MAKVAPRDLDSPVLPMNREAFTDASYVCSAIACRPISGNTLLETPFF